MTTRLVAIGDRTQAMPVLAMLVAVAVLLTVAVPASANAATKPTPVLAQGAGMGHKTSAAVRSVQRVLQRRGYDLGRPGVDGRFGPLTAAAVRRLQTDFGLAVDGIVGAKTRKLMRVLAHHFQRPSTGRRHTARERRPAPGRNATGQPVPKKAPAGDRTQTNDNGWLVPVAAGAAVAAFCTALWVVGQSWTRRRRSAWAALAPIARELYVEGRSEDERVGEFRGHVLAATLTAPPGEEPAQEQTSYLVDDARRGAPIWVRAVDIQRSPSRLRSGEPVIGYVTVSSGAERPHETHAKAELIEDQCERAGWDLVEVVTDREAGRSLDRPGLAYALEQIVHGNARGLIVADLRRLSRSIIDLGALMGWFRDAEAGLVALDLGVDTSTPAGHEVAATLITLSGWESERIARRTRSGLAEVRASGRRAGRPAVSDQPGLSARITAMRAASMTLQAIADQLNAERVPTLRGGAMWRPSSVQAALGYRRPGSRSPRDQLPALEDRQT
jgi:DNA invertase Pin-like site-specific DNA recombinase/peptidoglycan hydrolase-like protein with peptidoglycan-binding domain